MTFHNRETPYETLIKRDVAERLGLFTTPAIKIHLNERERERVATKGGLKGVDRDDDLALARVIKDLVTK